MEKGSFEKAGPVLVVGTVFVLCAAAFWAFLSREPGRVQRGGDDRKIATTQTPLKGTKALPIPDGSLPGSQPANQTPRTDVAPPKISTSDPHANPDTAPEAGPPVFEQPNMDGPPPDTTYYPGPDPNQVDPNVPDGPPADNTYYPGPPPMENQPGQPDGPPAEGPNDPTQGPPQDPAQPQPK